MTTAPDPADLPVGTVLTYNGMTARKTGPSDRDPWPWTCNGVAYTDDWAAAAIGSGARVTLPPPRPRWPWPRS
ncbi:hypothetical protein M8I35_22230 [Micromonospora sp. MSM11]|nr:hypothetical protein [Micromonospora sp. MSM11]MCL7459897.1 hypothetical protein [Micromonospora sp. MSM11]